MLQLAADAMSVGVVMLACVFAGFKIARTREATYKRRWKEAAAIIHAKPADVWVEPEIKQGPIGLPPKPCHTPAPPDLSMTTLQYVREGYPNLFKTERLPLEKIGRVRPGEIYGERLVVAVDAFKGKVLFTPIYRMTEQSFLDTSGVRRDLHSFLSSQYPMPICKVCSCYNTAMYSLGNDEYICVKCGD